MATSTMLPNVAPSLLANPELCTLSTCPLSAAHIQYVPSLPGNALYAAVFGLAILTQLFLGIRYRTWGYLVGMTGGILLEIIGYIARIQMHFNPFIQSPFLMYLCCLTIGPAFLSASIYICLSRIVIAYSEKISLLKPRNYTILFIIFDFIALLLQAIGGAIASTANTHSSVQMGINIMVAGVAWQVACLSLFAVLCGEFARRVRLSPDGQLEDKFDDLRKSFKFQAFLVSLGVATLTIFTRSVFRCAELSGGFHGALANQQVTFMILEGAMIVIAVILLTVFHPGLAFQGAWTEASWTLRAKQVILDEKKVTSSRQWPSWIKTKSSAPGPDSYINQVKDQ